MVDRLIIAPEVEQDIAEGYCWYEARRIGLGEDLLSAVDACIQGLCRAPDMHAKDAPTSPSPSPRR